ncbi:uncharacterized protein LACBIDRAFT_304105 [Laccaria bicolor S238N-H82]|uniref:Predicted protein n=1 Tax=Laccaria bicolor (strain S238N-H82 / ATCC MYA-4686) TaxID=486041 RepID=B0DKY7_LACBS|nr:uncharacterized protein LACBIDRAFT_304105 [Laccaria bicolor S238N-H82]EDR04820.1 predicted protein [Laccaria bicolor S238N-H82]|eukprot:XP_001884644.1 predicted protein [Laccaria bicolor S238N-H82]
MGQQHQKDEPFKENEDFQTRRTRAIMWRRKSRRCILSIDLCTICHCGRLNSKRTFKALLEDIEDEALVASHSNITRERLVTSSNPNPPTSSSHVHPGYSHVIGFLNSLSTKSPTVHTYTCYGGPG